MAQSARCANAADDCQAIDASKPTIRLGSMRVVRPAARTWNIYAAGSVARRSRKSSYPSPCAVTSTPTRDVRFSATRDLPFPFYESPGCRDSPRPEAGKRRAAHAATGQRRQKRRSFDFRLAKARQSPATRLVSSCNRGQTAGCSGCGWKSSKTTSILSVRNSGIKHQATRSRKLRLSESLESGAGSG